MAEVLMDGLDGSNPLGFFAALGTLAALHPSRATLRWQWQGAWHPVVDADVKNLDDLVAILDADRSACSLDAALKLQYAGKRDLKPPPVVFRQYLESLVESSGPHSRRSVDWAACFATDVAIDNNGNTKPTALHFTAGQQQFLQMVGDLVVGVTKDDLKQAVAGPWRYDRPLPVMGWDSTTSRDYALRASDPSTDKKFGVPGADWLALRGLAFFPAMPVGTKVVTSGCDGGWKSGQFRWPIWNVPIGVDVVRSLITLRVDEMSAIERTAIGVGAVFSAGIKRSDQGGYGSFEPASVL
jgi:hypothetical protein